MLAIVNYPTPGEVRENQDKLTASEKAAYAKQMELDAAFVKIRLESATQLPDIPADPLVLVWDIEFESEGETAGEPYTIIKHQGRVIWRERAYYECVGRFNEVVKVLREKYGDRLKALVPTSRSETYLYGDIISPDRKAVDISTSFPLSGIEVLAACGDRGVHNDLVSESDKSRVAHKNVNASALKKTDTETKRVRRLKLKRKPRCSNLRRHGQ